MATSAEAVGEADAPTRFSDLPDDVLERIACALAEDLCAGVASVCRLSRVDKRLHGLALSADTLARCAAQHGLQATSASLELLDVVETVTGLGTNRVFFASGRRPLTTDTKPTIRAGSSMPRLIEFALLLRRHPTLIVRVEGHEGPQENKVYHTVDGHELHASSGASLQRMRPLTRSSEGKRERAAHV